MPNERSLWRALGRLVLSIAAPKRPSPLVLVATLALSTPALGDGTPVGGGVPVVTSRNMQTVAHFNDFPHPSGGRGYSSCWSYVHGDGREYAILGAHEGTVFYNITDPATAWPVGFIPGPPSVWRGARTYGEWVYLITEGLGPGQGLQIVSMADPDNPMLVNTYTGSFVRVHTISVDEARGLLFLNGTRNAAGQQNGMVIMSLADPANPVELVQWPGIPMTGVDSLYAHDSMAFGNLLYAANIYSGSMRILDITDPTAPVMVSRFDYPGGFTHSSAADPSGHYQYICDEAPGEPLKVFDVSDPFDPRLVNRVAGDPNAIVHNSYVDGDTLYLANFSRGVRLFDISDPAHPAEFAWADSRPEVLGYYYSVWNVCPYFPSRSVIASDMENGLFVYRPVRDYGILRIEVIDAGNGEPLEGVTLTMPTLGEQLVTPASGVARFAPHPGGHTVEIERFGYVGQVVNHPVALGQRDTVVVALPPLPVAPFSGVIRDAVTLQPLDGAEIVVGGLPDPLYTDASGSFTISMLPLDDYTIEVRRPGYARVTVELSVNAGVAQDFLLNPAATYDPLETDTGWQAGHAFDDATAGGWERVDPVGTGEQPVSTIGETNPIARTANPGRAAARTHFSADDPGASILHDELEMAMAFYPHAVQPEDDRTPDPGTHCFVTGQGTIPEEYWAGNVDQGRTTLISPAFDMTGMADPSIAYWRWFYSDGDAFDWLAVAISDDDGANWTPVDSLRGIHNRWDEQVIRVADHVTPTDQVRVRFEVQDGGGGSMVEGAIDDVITYDAAGAPLAVDPADIARLTLRAPWPNPARGAVHLALEMPRAGRLDVEIVDLAGRRIRTLHAGSAQLGLMTLAWDGTDDLGRPSGPGLYFVRAVSDAETTVARVVKLR